MNELTKKFMCILMRGEIEIWSEEERLKTLIDCLKNLRQNVFVEIDEQLINTVDVIGIFNPRTMEEKTRRKNGQWKCKFNNWHDKNEKCECVDENKEKIRHQRICVPFYKSNGFWSIECQH